MHLTKTTKENQAQHRASPERLGSRSYSFPMTVGQWVGHRRLSGLAKEEGTMEQEGGQMRASALSALSPEP